MRRATACRPGPPLRIPTGYCLTSTGSLALGQVVIPEPAVERGGRDAEHLGGLAAVPAGLLQCGENLLALDLAQWRRDGRDDVALRVAAGSRGGGSEGESRRDDLGREFRG